MRDNNSTTSALSLHTLFLAKVLAQFTAFINQLVAERRQKPGTDMISLLTMAYTEQNLDFAELPSLCILILNAGRSTTTDLIPNGVSALLNHPQQLQKLKDNPALISSAIEEIIRYDSSVSFVFRIAKEDIEIGGQKIPAGSVIALGLGAANHDPAKFPLPDNFDIERSPNEHLGFSPWYPFLSRCSFGSDGIKYLLLYFAEAVPKSSV